MNQNFIRNSGTFRELRVVGIKGLYSLISVI